jgi:hypothetical protein
MVTNRELYLRVLAVGDELRTSGRTLSEYLRALLTCGQPLRERTSLSAEEFARVLESAVRETPPPLDPDLRGRDLAIGEPTGFARWEATLLSQVADLWDFDERLPGEDAYFGVAAPRSPGNGRRVTDAYWYNLDPATYLECAMAGSFGGHDPEDGVRKPVSGPVDPLVPEDPPTMAVGRLSWDDLADFAINGQEYE